MGSVSLCLSSCRPESNIGVSGTLSHKTSSDDQAQSEQVKSNSNVKQRRVERDEWPVLLLSGGFSFGSVALAIFIRTWSDTLFLTRFQADQIAIFYIWSALIFAPTTMGYAWLSQRFNPIKLNTTTLFAFAGLSSL